tara:strand:+ start:116 stop:646 length:531 start_codon:yes stop_codon:yes gene_type:complete
METLTEIKETPLSNEDINIMLNGTKIFKYPDLEDMNSIDEIFDDQGRAVMLFLTKDENTGHWISLHKKENIIYYFDPYGYDVDEEKELIPDYKLEELNQEQPFLMDLFKKSKYKVYSNQYAFQNRNAKNVNTCGRHCVVRLIYKNLDLDDYLDMIKSSGYTPDNFVSKLTYKIIQK